MKSILSIFQAPRSKPSFDTMLAPHLATLFKQAYRYVGNTFDAEDLLQDVLLECYQRRSKLDDVNNLGAWLNRCLYHRFIDFHRRQGRRPEMENVDNPELQPLLLGEQLDEQHYFEQQLVSGLDALSLHQKAVINLHDLCGFTLPEIEPIMGMPVGTLKSHLHRGRKRLKAHLQLEHSMLDNNQIGNG
jgi:RNA polymerase sigma-70 factor (ECF subfamily)